MPDPAPPADDTGYLEVRRHELRKRSAMMVDGHLTSNTRSSEGGTSARVYRDGYWGFASVPGGGPAAAERVGRQALDNVQAMARFGQRSAIRFKGMQVNPALPAGTFQFKPPAGADVVKQ